MYVISISLDLALHALDMFVHCGVHVHLTFHRLTASILKNVLLFFSITGLKLKTQMTNIWSLFMNLGSHIGPSWVYTHIVLSILTLSTLCLLI